MSTVADLIRAVSRVAAVGERIAELSDRLGRLEADHQQTRERLVRIEAFVSIVQPAVQHKLTNIKDQP